MKYLFATCGMAIALLGGWGAVTLGEEEPSKPEALFKSLDANADGILKADEVTEEQKKLFERLVRIGDENKDGELSQQEFTSALKADEDASTVREERGRARDERGNAREERSRPIRDFEPGKVFERLDADGDGKVTREEIREAGEPIRNRLEQRLEGLNADALILEDFKSLLAERLEGRRGPEGGRGPARGEGDRPGRGGERRPDFRGRGGDEGRPGPPPMPPFFKALDTDNDGKLSKDELAKAAEKFDELDGNHDGSLDPHEVLGPPPERRGPPPGFDGRRDGGRPGFGIRDRIREGLEERRPEIGGRGGFGPPVGDRRGDEGRPPRRDARDELEGRGADRPGPPRDGEGRAGRPGLPPFMFEQFDADGDGKVSEEEAVQRIKSRFAELDSNSDGFVDRDEIRRSIADRAAGPIDALRPRDRRPEPPPRERDGGRPEPPPRDLDDK